MLHSLISRLRPATLRGRLILSVAVVHAVMMSVFIVDLTGRQREALLAHRERTAGALTQALATASATWLAANDLAGMQELVDNQRSFPECRFAILADADGLVLAHTDRARVGQVLADIPGQSQARAISSSQELVDAIAPVRLGNRHVGWARVGLGQQTTERQLGDILAGGAVYAAIAILVGSILAWMMGSRITRRLYAVQGTINKIKAGDGAARSHLSGDDEAAVLAREFNAMLDRLAERDAALHRSEAGYRTLFDDLPVAVWEVDLSAVRGAYDRPGSGGGLAGAARIAGLITLLRANRLGAEIFCASDATQLSGGLPRLLGDDALPGFVRMLDALLAEGFRRVGSELPMHNLQGGSLTMDISAVVVPGHEATLGRVLMSFQDISQRRIQERELECHRQHLEEMVEQRTAALRASYAEAERMLSILSAILIGVDGEGRIIRFNSAAERISGRTAAAMIGVIFAESHLLKDAAAVSRQLEVAMAERTTREIRDQPCRRSDGTEAFLDLSIIPTAAVDGSGRGGVILVGFDVTTRREEEARRTQNQNLESIGQLAAGVAHEINTPIQFIGDNLQFLRNAFTDLEQVMRAAQSLADGSGTAPDLSTALSNADAGFLVHEVPRAIDQSQHGVDQVAHIVRALKDFAHPGATSRQAVDVNECLRTTIEVARNEYRYIANLSIDLAQDIPLISAVPSELNQTFLNLLVNAAHAIQAKLENGGGVGRIKGTIAISSRCSEGMIEIRIRDNGCGIAPEHRQRLFTPFFTTKPVGMGTGQGLSLCHAFIVKHHGGTIDCESEPGVGSVFIIRVPLLLLPAAGGGSPQASQPRRDDA
ncbi:MAG: PAS domain-containing protein [Caulobacterales bacterium]|nr:PAS domain-containing protein [Caulobacterales bacterium]